MYVYVFRTVIGMWMCLGMFFSLSIVKFPINFRDRHFLPLMALRPVSFE